jgi:tyrosine-protein kinase Etk/Wzc
MADGVASVGRDWLTVIRRRGWVIAEVAIVSVLASALAGRVQPEKYETHSELVLYSQKEGSQTRGAGQIQTSVSPETWVRMIKTQGVLEQVADMAGIGKTATRLQALADELDPRIIPSESKNTTETTVWVYVKDRSAQMAADIANYTAQVVVEGANNDATKSTGKALETTKTLVLGRQKELTDTENALKDLKEAGSPLASSDDAGAGTRISNYAQVESSLATARVEITATQQELRRVKEDLLKEPQHREQTTSVRNPFGESLRQQIMNLEVERAALLRDFTEKSEQVQVLDRRLDGLKRALTSEQERVTDQIQRQPNNIYEGLRTHRATLEAQLAALKGREGALAQLLARRQEEVRAVPTDQTTMARKLREQRVQEQLYLMLLQRQYDLQIEKDSIPTVAALGPRAAVPITPSEPKRGLYVAIGLVCGLLLGLIAAGLVDQLDDTFGDDGEAERHLGVPVLGHVPIAAADDLPLPQIKSPTSPCAEGLRGLVPAMQATWGDRPPRVIMVAGPGREDGRSTVAANMAVAFAETGRRVILADGDLRSPTLHEYFGLPRGPGLVDAIAEDQPLEGLLHPVTPNLRVLTSGSESPNPGALLVSQRAQAIWKPLSELADLVIVDTPPVLLVPDARMIAASADAAIVVLTRGTKRHAAHDAVTLLGRAGTEVLGVMWNREPSGRRVGSYYRGLEPTTS